MNFLQNGEARGELEKQIANSVQKAVLHEEWRLEYMILLQRDREKIAERISRGIAQGVSERNAQLILSLQHKGKSVEEIAELLDLTVTEVREMEGLEEV